jgi:hypothetical protein
MFRIGYLRAASAFFAADEGMRMIRAMNFLLVRIAVFVLLAQRLPLPIPRKIYNPHDSPFARRSIGCLIVGACVCLLGLAYMATVGWVWPTWVSGAGFLVPYGLATIAVRRRWRSVALQQSDEEF